MRSILALVLTLVSSASFAQSVLQATDEIKIPTGSTEIDAGSAMLHCTIPVVAKDFDRKISKSAAFEIKGATSNSSLLTLAPSELLTLVRQMKLDQGETLDQMLTRTNKTIPAYFATTADLNAYLAKEFGFKINASWTLTTVQLQSRATQAKFVMTCWEQSAVTLPELMDQLSQGAKLAPSTEL